MVSRNRYREELMVDDDEPETAVDARKKDRVVRLTAVLEALKAIGRDVANRGESSPSDDQARTLAATLSSIRQQLSVEDRGDSDPEAPTAAASPDPVVMPEKLAEQAHPYDDILDAIAASRKLLQVKLEILGGSQSPKPDPTVETETGWLPSEAALLAAVSEKFYGSQTFRALGLAILAAVVIGVGGSLALLGQTINLYERIRSAGEDGEKLVSTAAKVGKEKVDE